MSSTDIAASANSRSAPASAYRLRRRIASAMPCVASTSVRDLMTKSGSLLAAAAARIFCTISSAGITSLPFMWPQRLGHTWSSSIRPATPARSNARTVW